MNKETYRKINNKVNSFYFNSQICLYIGNLSLKKDKEPTLKE